MTVYRGLDETLAGSPNLAAVLDGDTGHITIDGLGADAYGQTKVATGYVMLVKSVTPGSRFWASISNQNASSTYQIGLAATATGGAEGQARAVFVLNGSIKLNVDGPANTQHIDGAWHLIHSADHYNAPNGDVFVQVDGATRTLLGSYLRYADPVHTMCSLGVLRRNVGPVPTGFSAGTLGYFARYDDEALDQDSWDAIAAAWDTGGGRQDTRRISEAIQGELTTGAVKWAGQLDGSRPHANPDSVAAPIYVDVDFELADF